VSAATLVRARSAGIALAARQEHLDRDGISHAHTPARRAAWADLFDDPDRLVARYERVARKQFAGELLMVGATETACFDAQQTVVVADRRQGQSTVLETAGRHEERGARRRRVLHAVAGLFTTGSSRATGR
jgi:hypothetical protein